VASYQVLTVTGQDYSLAISDALLCGTGLMLRALLMAVAVLHGSVAPPSLDPSRAVRSNGDSGARSCLLLNGLRCTTPFGR